MNRETICKWTRAYFDTRKLTRDDFDLPNLLQYFYDDYLAEVAKWKDAPAKALPRLVVCAILIRDGKVLLERRAPAGVAGLDGKWDLPGGKVECGETPESAIQREIKEELGITVHPMKMIPWLPISTWKYPDGEERHWILAAYVCSIESENDPVLSDTLRWFTLDEVNRIDILAADLQLLRMV